ncbi:MAG: hypothetical protein AAF543_03645 [Pseudomonadota bacterium]
MPDRQPVFLDRPAARVLAALVILLCAALLVYIHRDDVRTLTGADQGQGSGAASDDPAAACIEQRFAEIDGMVEEGVVGDEQAATFKQRAEAMCRATTGDGGSAPPLPVN